MVLHHDILILTHVTVQWRLMEGSLLYIFIQRPTPFLSSVSILFLIFRALSTQAENKGGKTVEGCVEWLYETALKWYVSFLPTFIGQN